MSNISTPVQPSESIQALMWERVIEERALGEESEKMKRFVVDLERPRGRAGSCD